MNTTKTKRETDFESIKSSMRLAMTSCGRTHGRVIIGGNIRIYINMGTGNSYYVADRMDDGILRHAFFNNGIKQASLTYEVECFNREWTEFLDEATDLARRLGISITVCEEP